MSDSGGLGEAQAAAGTTPQERGGLSLATAVGSVAVFVGALIVGLYLVRPWIAGAVAFDTATSALYFQRIVSGHQLEAFITTTPKPLLTLVDGLLYTLTHDWRVVSAATIVAYAAAVTAAWQLLGRWAGVAGAAFAAVGLLGAATVLNEVAIAYAVPWAVLLWAVAAIAVSRPQPRYGLAGLALMAATLVRLETLVLVGAIGALLLVLTAARHLLPRLGGAPPRTFDRRAWLLLLGGLAVPIMCLHDWRLAGDPTYWLLVPNRYSAAAGAAVMSPPELVRSLAHHLAHEWLLWLVAALGTVVTLRARNWPAIVGLAALGPAMALFLLWLSLRGTFVSDRYYAAIDVALIGAAAMAFGPLQAVLRSRPPGGAARHRWPRRTAAGFPIVLAALAAVVAVWPTGLLDRTVLDSFRTQRTLARHADEAVPILSAGLDTIPGSRVVPPGLTWRQSEPGLTILRVPTPDRPRLALDLDLPLPRIGGISGAMVTSGATFAAPSRLIFHDRGTDRPSIAFATLEIDQQTVVGDRVLTPLAARPDEGWWVVGIKPFAR